MFHCGNEGWRDPINLLPTLFISLISFNGLLCTDYDGLSPLYNRELTRKIHEVTKFILADFLFLFLNDI